MINKPFEIESLGSVGLTFYGDLVIHIPPVFVINKNCVQAINWQTMLIRPGLYNSKEQKPFNKIKK